jgi:hypothetical protein
MFERQDFTNYHAFLENTKSQHDELIASIESFFP